MIEVTILSRPECRLCAIVLKMARRIQVEIPFKLDHIDISDKPDLVSRYGSRIPVVLINQAERFSGRVTEEQLRKAIKRARRRQPISRILSRLSTALSEGDHFS
jgi:glutaredoxin